MLSGGVPGNKGGTGRPPNEYLEWCREILNDPKCKGAVKDILTDKTHPAFSTMYKLFQERVHGRPEQKIEHSGNVTLSQLIVGPEEQAAGFP